MKVWIVEATDRNYDEGDSWVSGVYSSQQKAIKAEKILELEWERLE